MSTSRRNLPWLGKHRRSRVHQLSPFTDITHVIKTAHEDQLPAVKVPFPKASHPHKVPSPVSGKVTVLFTVEFSSYLFLGVSAALLSVNQIKLPCVDHSRLLDLFFFFFWHLYILHLSSTSIPITHIPQTHLLTPKRGNLYVPQSTANELKFGWPDHRSRQKKTLLQNAIVSGTICLKVSDPLQFRLHIIRLSFGETFLFLTLSTKWYLGLERIWGDFSVRAQEPQLLWWVKEPVRKLCNHHFLFALSEQSGNERQMFYSPGYGSKIRETW